MIRPDCRHPDGAYHDCDRVNLRNAQIPAAERYASQVVGWRAPTEEIARHEWNARWNRAFFEEMDRLMANAGARRAA